MTNPKALAVTDRAALSNTLFENPELTAMAAICEILQELPDDAARMRVMHWSFGRFASEFKRGSAQSMTPKAPAPLALVPPLPAAPQQVAQCASADMSTQVSELEDLFAPDSHTRSADLSRSAAART